MPIRIITNANVVYTTSSRLTINREKQCGLVFTLPEPLRPIYEAWQIDIPDHNGDDSFELPIPATYIIDHSGTVRYAHVKMDYSQRLEPDIIIEQLKSL